MLKASGSPPAWTDAEVVKVSAVRLTERTADILFMCASPSAEAALHTYHVVWRFGWQDDEKTAAAAAKEEDDDDDEKDQDSLKKKLGIKDMKDRQKAVLDDLPPRKKLQGRWRLEKILHPPPKLP
jgi:hypothetical protein